MSALSFDQPDLAQRLAAAGAEELDAAEFGIIGFDADTVVRQYNRFESQAAGLSPASVLSLPLFTTVAPCMNNYMVAQRFEDAAADGSALDDTIGYVLTLRMKPVKVLLRLLALPGAPMRYVLVQRRL
ncbi:phosphonate transporter [Pseudoduganella chitinolytica]|uniref:Phosphonate transporter n=1 Tax=Pseudoduganella chitinolytica TaxID=34070 RepID=A0ABY8B414_9BURK|nr:phosphonate transporter [Pseudoduganella chitinolytica]WEF30687.1 phosphonate transporter [Pseudoduganella chitinolytica]